MKRPLIAVTMGDPAGVGPEVALQLLANPRVSEFALPIVFGDIHILTRCAAQTGLPRPIQLLDESEWNSETCLITKPTVLHIEGFDDSGFMPGIVSAATGAAGYRYVLKSIEAALEKRIHAVTTGPLNKEALRAAGVHFPGHTEIFADKCGASRACMFQYSDEVRAAFVTVHVGYVEAATLITRERIEEVIELTVEAMQRLDRPNPSLVVLGLNPHAGEHGLFGNGEEEKIISPAIEACRARGYRIEGPVPPDTAFLPDKRHRTDAYICMYHDQGHIPLKALAFDTAVNTTLGLPIIRTSVDHGTACDIAWQGKAKASSLFEAVRLAARLAHTESTP
jgi:4-hydroxythreonine-4-phosphate dehydrogenase